jgi:RNA polymerase sigma-70 factor (ECF subfamily)
MTAAQRFARARPRLLRLAYSELGDLGEAEDVVQEAWLRLERTAFVLHDIFDVPFGDVAEVVGRTPEAVRQLASRARRHIARQRPRFEAAPDEHARAVRAFAQAVAEGDLEGLVAVLDPDVVWTSDGGGRAIASLKPLRGADRVARGWVALRRKGTIGPIATPIELNGRPGLLIAGADGDRSILSFMVDGGRIARIDVVRNPEKLRRVRQRSQAQGSPSRGRARRSGSRRQEVLHRHARDVGDHPSSPYASW